MGGCREHAACLKIAPSVVSLVHELQGDLVHGLAVSSTSRNKGQASLLLPTEGQEVRGTVQTGEDLGLAGCSPPADFSSYILRQQFH